MRLKSGGKCSKRVLPFGTQTANVVESGEVFIFEIQLHGIAP
jgi:hypothetical protein